MSTYISPKANMHNVRIFGVGRLPGPITDVTAAPAGPNAIQLSSGGGSGGGGSGGGGGVWGGSSSGASGYQYSLDGGSTWGAVGPDGLISGLNPNSGYTVLVRGVNANGYGPVWAIPGTITTPQAFTPSTFGPGTGYSTEGYVTVLNVVGPDISVAKGKNGFSRGKFYWEMTSRATEWSHEGIGLANQDATADQYLNNGFFWIWYSHGALYNIGERRNQGEGFSRPSTTMIACDLDAGRLYLGKDDRWIYGNPAIDLDGLYLPTTNQTWFPYYVNYQGIGYVQRKSEFNFGQKPMQFQVPPGYIAGWPDQEWAPPQ